VTKDVGGDGAFEGCAPFVVGDAFAEVRIDRAGATFTSRPSVTANISSSSPARNR